MVSVLQTILTFCDVIFFLGVVLCFIFEGLVYLWLLFSTISRCFSIRASVGDDILELVLLVDCFGYACRTLARHIYEMFANRVDVSS